MIKIRNQIRLESPHVQQAVATIENTLMYKKVKSRLFTLISIVLAASLFFVLTSCESSSEKVKSSEVDLLKAEQDLEKANAEYKKDVEAYRIETKNKIDSNNKQIVKFKSRIDSKDKDKKEEYNKQVEKLERKNQKMKSKMNNYKADSKDNWESFKTDFNREMDELGSSINTLFTRSE